MPPKCKFSREQMVSYAVNLVRKSGAAGLTARALAAELGCSVKPIFGLFRNMEDLKNEVIRAADALYQARLRQAMSEGRYPPYKASGIAYIQFAQKEKELFKLLFMRDRTGEETGDERAELGPILALIMENLELNEEDALRFHMETWVYVHGIAAMIATSYLDWNMEFISRTLTDVYEGLKYRYTAGR